MELNFIIGGGSRLTKTSFNVLRHEYFPHILKRDFTSFLARQCPMKSDVLLGKKIVKKQYSTRDREKQTPLQILQYVDSCNYN